MKTYFTKYSYTIKIDVIVMILQYQNSSSSECMSCDFALEVENSLNPTLLKPIIHGLTSV